MQHNANLVWQNFIIAKSGVTNLPLRRNLAHKIQMHSEITQGDML
jgi:hypothetical protein